MDLHLEQVSGSWEDLDDILHLLPLKAHLEATGWVVAFTKTGGEKVADSRWKLLAWLNRWLSLGLCSECPFLFQTDKSPGVFSPNNIPFFKVMGRRGLERKAAFSLRVSANSLAWIGQCGWHSKEGGDTDIYTYTCIWMDPKLAKG